MCLVWNFKRANIASIKSAIYVVNVKFLLSNKSVLEQVSIFNKRLMIFFSNYISNKFVTIHGKSHKFKTTKLLLITKSLYIGNKKFTNHNK